MREGLKLLWTKRALDDLRSVSERSPQHARAVVEAMEFISEIGWSLGHPVVLGKRQARYWPVPPLGVYYVVRGNVLSVGRVRDARRLRRPPD